MVALRTLQERVRKSALRLDKEVENWERKVSVKTLDIQHNNRCITGQLGTGNGLHNHMDVKRGFWLRSSEYGIDDSNIKVLNRLWVKQIRKRRKADYAKRKVAKILAAKGNTRKLKSAVSGRDFAIAEFNR